MKKNNTKCLHSRWALRLMPDKAAFCPPFLQRPPAPFNSAFFFLLMKTWSAWIAVQHLHLHKYTLKCCKTNGLFPSALHIGLQNINGWLLLAFFYLATTPGAQAVCCECFSLSISRLTTYHCSKSPKCRFSLDFFPPVCYSSSSIDVQL